MLAFFVLALDGAVVLVLNCFVPYALVACGGVPVLALDATRR